MYFPSVVELITAPTIWSALILTLIVTIPTILITSLIKILVIRKSIMWNFKKLLLDMFITNCITSLVRTPMFGWSIFWQGLFISYVLTSLWETFLIRGWLDLKTGDRNFKPFLLLSIKMNTASYAFLSITVASLVYLPYISNDHPEMRKTLSGNLLLIDGSSLYRILNIDDNRFISGNSNNDNILLESGLQCSTIVSGDTIVGVDREYNIKKLKINHNGMISESIIGHIRNFERVEAISKDSRYILCLLKSNAWIIYDSKFQNTHMKAPVPFKNLIDAQFGNDFILITGRDNNENKAITVNLKNGAVRNLKNISSYFPALSPDSKKIAWQQGKIIRILDLKSGITKKFFVQKSYFGYDASDSRNDRLAWSPDCHYIVHIGTVNQFLRNCYRYDLIAIDTENGQHTSLYKYIWIRHSASKLLWL